MGSNSNQTRLLPFAKGIIRKKAKSMVGKGGFTYSDLRDIEQSLMLEVLRRADRFDPLRGSEIQFVTTIVRNAAASIISHQLTAKRGKGIACVSLDKEIRIKNGESITGHELVDKEVYLRSTQGRFGSQENRLGFRIDLDRAVKTLHPNLCELATRLMASTPSEIARDTGIPRTTLNGLIAKFRSRLLINGLSEYLNFHPSDFNRFR